MDILMFCFSKIRLRYLYLLFAAIFLCSCTKKSIPQKLEPIKNCTFPDNPKQTAPLWICYVDIEGYPIYGIGSTEKSKAGINFMMQKAATQARVQIAQELKTYIDNTIKVFMANNKIGDSETAKNISYSITSQITQNDLIGSRVIRTAVSSNGILYVLVGLNKENYQSTLKNIFNKVSKENISNRFITEQEFSDLEKQFLNENSINE